MTTTTSCYTLEDLNQRTYQVGDVVHFRHTSSLGPTYTPLHTGTVRAVIPPELVGDVQKYRVDWWWDTSRGERHTITSTCGSRNLVPARPDNPEDPT
jgi:hypothetical protein